MLHAARQLPAWLIFDVGQRTMKRDLSLVRAILMRCESAPAGSVVDTASLSDLGADRSILAEHIAIVAEAGLVDVLDMSTQSGADYIVNRLTWAGHEFLQSIRDDSLWNKAKDHVLKPGASWTFELLKEWLKQELKRRIGLPD